MFPHISIVINYSFTASKLLLLVGTAMCLIACTLSGKGIIPCLVLSKSRYSKLSLAQNDYSALILKPAAFSLLRTIFTLCRWSSKLTLLMMKRSLISALTYSKPLNNSNLPHGTTIGHSF